jgi:putative phosphoribosyl transferase
MLVGGLGATQRDPSRAGAIIEGVFFDRQDAGRKLAPAVAERVRGDAVVLGVPRGGVLVALPVARAVDAPLDVVVPKKIGAPDNPELGLGAIAPGVRVLDEDLIGRLGVAPAYIEEETARVEAEIARRTERYRGGRPAVALAQRTAVIVDDGVATGGTAFAAVAWARAQGPASVVFAAPVGPASTAGRLAAVCDEVVFLLTPANFSAVGQWYERFDQVTDEEVREALAIGA